MIDERLREPLVTEVTPDGPAISPDSAKPGKNEQPKEKGKPVAMRRALAPLLFITDAAMHEMVQEVVAHSSIETSWGQYGLIIQGTTEDEPDIVIVTGVLRPSAIDITRQFAHTTLGGRAQADAVRWLEHNYTFALSRGITTTVKGRFKGEPHFAYLFKGHSHHGLGVGSYSSTDFRSIYEVIVTDGLEVAIGTLATIDLDGPRLNRGEQGVITLRQAMDVKLKFYVYTRRLWEAGEQSPVLVNPVVIKATEVPYTPPVGWHLVREDEFLEQLRHCTHYGCAVQIVERDVVGGPPFEIQFIISKDGWRATLVITTDWNYPNTPPTITTIPKGKSSRDTRPLQEPFEGPDWQQGFDFIDIIHRLERKGAL